MKTNIFFLVVCMMLMTTAACRRSTPPAAWGTDLTAALTAAATSKKPVLVEVSTDWCQYCQYLEEAVFTDSSVIKALGDFELVKLDGDKPDAQPIMEKYGVIGFPTFLILNADGSEKSRFNDARGVEEWKTLLGEAQSDRPGYREFYQAEMALGQGDDAEALDLYNKAETILIGMAADDPLRARVLKAKIAFFMSRDKKEEVRPLIQEYMGRYPTAGDRPLYMKKWADAAPAETINESRIEAVAALSALIESATVKNPEQLRMIIDEAVWELADLYTVMGQPEEAKATMKKGAALGHEWLSAFGGIARGRHLVGAIAKYHMEAGELREARAFLNEAQTVLPTYWPVYQSLARLEMVESKWVEAAQWAEKAYGLAEAVSKPRVALVWADALDLSGDRDAAVALLKRAEADLSASGPVDAGRSKRVMRQLVDKERTLTKMKK